MPEDDSRHADLGKTPRGTPVKLNLRFVEADVRIVTGLVEPHFMAGYSGGRKVVAPGIAHRDTITTFHNSAFMSHPNARNCVLEGNPLHEEQLAIVGMLDSVYALNTVIDENRQLSYINFGEVVASHQEAVRFCERYSRVEVPRKFQTVVTTAAGYPLDKTYYQTVKGIVSALDIVADGGTLVIASECSEGLGSEPFRRAQERLLNLGKEAFLSGIAGKANAEIDEWQTQMLLRDNRGVNIVLFSGGLDAESRVLAGVTVRPIEELSAGVLEIAMATDDHAVAIIPEGPYVIPVLR